MVDKQLLLSKATLLASGLLALRLHTNTRITAVVQLNTHVLVGGAADTSHYLSSNSSELLSDVLFPQF